jgi:hypothetical protein
VRERQLLQPSFLVSQNSHDSTLNVLIEAMQAARDEYGEAEFAYNQFEDLVDAHEFDLLRRESKVYNTEFRDVAVPPPESPHYGLRHPYLDDYLGLGSSSSEPEREYHPLHFRYLTRLGDLDLARERYQNIVDERDGLLMRQDTRLPLGLELEESGRQFLADFQAQEAALSKEIEEVEADVERLRLECQEEGVQLHEERSESSYGESTRSQVLADLNHSPQSTEETRLEPRMYSVLLPEPEDRNKLGGLITDFIEGNKSDRINRWIQYQLRTSPSEIELLVRVFLGLERYMKCEQWVVDLGEWQSNVLSWWPRDAANRPQWAFTVARTESAATRTSSSEDSYGLSNPAINAEDTTIASRGFILHRRAISLPLLSAIRSVFGGGGDSEATTSRT